MNDKKEKLIEQLTNIIKELPDDALLSNEKHIDLLSLFEELVALKSEVKKESRQLKSALEDFREVFCTLKSSNEILAQELQEQRKEQTKKVEQKTKKIIKPIIMDLLDISDRLHLALEHLNNYRPNWIAKMLPKEKMLINSALEGQKIIYRRIEQLFKKYQIESINTVGFSFDSDTMRVIAIETNTDVENNLVMQEFRKGFIWEGDVLRTAEVKVNKIEE